MLFEVKPKIHVKSELTYIFVLLHQLIYVVLFPQLQMSCSYGGYTLYNPLLMMYVVYGRMVTASSDTYSSTFFQLQGGQGDIAK